MKQDDLFIPPLAQFKVKCMPSGRVRYVISPSFAGAARTAKDVQIRGHHDREFYPRFERWVRGFGDPKRTGEPPQDFVYPEYMFDPEYNASADRMERQATFSQAGGCKEDYQ